MSAAPNLTAVPNPEANGDADQHGDVDSTATPTFDRAACVFELHEDGFPANPEHVKQITPQHRAYLRHTLVTEDGLDDPGDVSADELVAWILHHAYNDDTAPTEEPAAEPLEGQVTVDEAIAEAEAATEQHVIEQDAGTPSALTITEEQLAAENAAHIPTASTPPTTMCACNGRGGFETDAGWEPCTNCDGAVEESGQLTLVPGGDAPVKSILNIGSLRHDLGRSVEFKDGDRVRVTFEMDIDKIAFIPEKSGGESKRRVRTHAGGIDLETVDVTVV